MLHFALLQAIIELHDDPNTVNTPTVTSEHELNYFTKPSPENLKAFFQYHPYQPSEDINFQPRKVYLRNDGTKRIWVSYSSELRKFFCYICLAFSNDRSQTFVVGYDDLKHLYQNLERHEKSKIHDTCLEHYLREKSQKTVKDLIDINLSRLRREQVEKRREILKRIIDTVKMLGKCGSGFRGKRNEAAYTLKDENVNHGNFLETILLLAKYDPLLQNHINEAAVKSCKSHDAGSKQGGGISTFLSKTTVNYIIEAIHFQMLKIISDEIREARMYSVQLDTTQDVSIMEQCSVIIRYVNEHGRLTERLVAMVKCESTTGASFVNHVKNILEKLNLDIHSCIGSATDGASNMRGEYSGFSTLFKNEIDEKHLYVWCYAHVLNLVLKAVTSRVLEALFLFNLIKDTFNFMRESYKRIDVWKRRVPGIGLGTMNETRWWAKAEALKKIFGTSTSPNSGLLPELLLSLHEISKSATYPNDVRGKAKIFLENFLKYKTVLTAQIFLQIFERTTPLSNYLQTEGADILKAQNMVKRTTTDLQEIFNDFDRVVNAANSYISWVEEKLEEADVDFEMETELPEVRLKKKKRQFQYECEDEPTAPRNAIEKFRIDVFISIRDSIINAMRDRFEGHGTLWADLSALDPKRFVELKHNLPKGTLSKLFSYISKFRPESTLEDFEEEFKDFINKWDSIKNTFEEDFFKLPNDNNESDHSDQEDDANRPTSTSDHSEYCKACPTCCFLVIKNYNLYKNAYPTLYIAYKFVLTLSIVQVSCEKSFSVLKHIKNRQRSTLKQDNLEAFMLMAIERDVLTRVSHDDIFSILIKKHAGIRKLIT